MSSRVRSSLPLAFAMAGLLVAGAFLLLQFCRPVWDWLTTPASGHIVVGPDAVQRFTDGLRDRYRERWRDRAEALRAIADELRALRDDRLDALAAAQDEGFRRELVALCATAHAPTERVDLDDPALTVADMFAAAVATEREIVAHYHDISAVYIADKRPGLAPVDVVGLVRVVSPQRIGLDETALLTPIRSKSDGRLAAFRAQIKCGISELEAMRKHGDALLAKARSVASDDARDGWKLDSDLAAGSNRGDPLLVDQFRIDDEGTSRGDFDARPGRVLGADGQGRASYNMYLDRWWVIGPFENRFNSNLDASFSPESVIDLDMQTKGKDGRTIGWTYWRSDDQRIEPDWAENGVVYYGWTEVWVEEAGDYWVATGSDDFGKLWINGELAWESERHPKSYRADECVAPMHFRRGCNEVLFRCTNKGGTMGWSVILLADAGS